ncbi:MAG: PaaI family thioesterase [Pelosinus sp.]|nr:PaaI family thioesterase [Pelosinus sp.]
MSIISDNQWCFACGTQNPIGLHLKFKKVENKYVTTFTAGPEHQSYNGVVHGGIISTLLDETMARYITEQDVKAVTARLDIRYRAATPIGELLTISGWVVGKRRNMYEMAGEIRLSDGTVTVESKGMIAVIEDVQK